MKQRHACLLAFLLMLGGCDAESSSPAPMAQSSSSVSDLVHPDDPCARDVVLAEGSGVALRYDLLDELREQASDDGVIEECEAVALAVGTRELDLQEIDASLEGSAWMVTLIARDGCQHWAELDALTGRARGGGRTCPESSAILFQR